MRQARTGDAKRSAQSHPALLAGTPSGVFRDIAAH